MDRVLYIADTESSVFESQVIGLLNKLADNDIDVTLLLGQRGPPSDAKLRTLNETIPVIHFKLLPSEIFFIPMQLLSLKKALREVGDFSDFVIHVRSEKYGMLLKFLHSDRRRPLKLLIDVRGAVEEESLYFKGFGPVRKKLKQAYFKVIQRSLRSCDFQFSAVSSELLRYVRAKYHLKNDQLCVTPCIALAAFEFDEEQRRNVREALGIGPREKVILFSSSGNAKWQALEKLTEFADNNPNFRLINLSRHTIDRAGVINKLVDFQEVPGYLNAADFGLVLREPSIVNMVACPVKFVEYAVSGLPIFSDGNVGAITDYIRDTKAGLLMHADHTSNAGALKALTNEQRKELSLQATAYFGIDAVTDSFALLYNKLSSPIPLSS